MNTLLAESFASKEQLWLAAGAGVLVLVLGLMLWLRSRRARTAAPIAIRPSIDVARLEIGGPTDVPHVTCYGVPVRLAVVVIAPAGREGIPPAKTATGEMLDEIVPSLGAVFQQDQPRVDHWPPQLSSHGFMRSLFTHAALPDQGKGTPWVALAGRAEFRGRSYVVGLVACAEKANSLGEVSVEHAGEWLNVLRIRES